MMRTTAIAGALMLLPSAAAAVEIGGVEFPQGAASFADAVISYDPAFGGGAVPTAPHQGASNALGVPDYTPGPVGCASTADCEYVSLGDGGRIVLQFTNNALTGSGTTADDLYIFEIGPDVEDTFVDISMDGINFFSVGAVGGSTSGVDIDAFGFGPGDLFYFVRLTDNGAEGGQSGATVGADIDAVGAITTVLIDPEPSDVPAPAALGLLGLGILGLAGARRRRG